jgi:hypothetical protein
MRVWSKDSSGREGKAHRGDRQAQPARAVASPARTRPLVVQSGPLCRGGRLASILSASTLVEVSWTGRVDRELPDHPMPFSDVTFSAVGSLGVDGDSKAVSFAVHRLSAPPARPWACPCFQPSSAAGGNRWDSRWTLGL